jgi:hypothetical protein
MDIGNQKMFINYYWVIIFCFLFLVIYTDESIARAVTLLSQMIKFQYEKTKWMILNDPRNPIVKYFMWKRAYKLAEELQKELEDKSK